MKQQLDVLGTACSGLCLIHCLATPVLVAAGSLGAVGALVSSETLHWALLGPIWLLAGLSFRRGLRQHNRIGPALFASIGIIGITVAALAWEGQAETLATVTGGICLIYAHIRNRSLTASMLAGESDTAAA